MRAVSLAKALAVTGGLLVLAALDLSQQGPIDDNGLLMAAAGAVPVLAFSVFASAAAE